MVHQCSLIVLTNTFVTIERLFTTLLSVLTFLKNEIYPRVELVSTDEQLRGFGRRILPDMFDQILKNFMTKMIPEHSNELVEYLAVIDKTVKFEEELDALGKLSNLVYIFAQYVIVLGYFPHPALFLSLILASGRNFFKSCSYLTPSHVPVPSH